MDKIRKIIKLLIIALIIAVIATIIILINYKNNKSEMPNIKTGENEVKSKEPNDREDYFILNACVRQYLDNINIEDSSFYGYDENDNYTKIVEEDEIKKCIYDLLSSNYIENKNITLDNLYENIKTVDEKLLFAPLEINLIHDSEIKTYYVYGVAQSIIDYNVILELHLAVNLDKRNNRFSIEILDNNSKLDNIKQVNNIKQNENNQIEIYEFTKQDIIEDYINLYKSLVLGTPEWFYNNILNNEYKDKCFENVEEFKKYIDDNRKQIIGTRALSYKIDETDSYVQYTIIDQNGNYYYFIEEDIMKYNVIPNNYVILIGDSLEEYNNSDNQQKVSLNIQRFIQAINDKNYKYAYNCLASEFRNNNFATIEDFKKYVNENLYTKNSIELFEYDIQDEIYTYRIEIIGENKSGESKSLEKTIIMKLNEGTGFELSFNV